jgi:hypothetical protein
MNPGSHIPGRPSWRCQDDGDLWPCALGRKHLQELYGDDERALATHMAWLMVAAADDLTLPDPSKLYRRFVRWVHGAPLHCGRCHKNGHQALPGLPPRLFPCCVERPR